MPPEVSSGSSRIFLSYRREDSIAHVNALFHPLRVRFGEDRVFKDTDNIAPGEDFLQAIQKQLKTCSVLLAVIGKQWLTVQKPKANSRRLDDPNDYLRVEVATALRNDNVLVIPILVGQATMPTSEELPADLAALARRNGFELRDSRWESDVKLLIQAIEKACGESPSDGIRKAGTGGLEPQRPAAGASPAATADRDSGGFDPLELKRQYLEPDPGGHVPNHAFRSAVDEPHRQVEDEFAARRADIDSQQPVNNAVPHEPERTDPVPMEWPGKTNRFRQVTYLVAAAAVIVVVGLLWWSSAMKPAGTRDVDVPSQATRTVPDSPPAPEVATTGRDVGSATSTDGPRETTRTSEPRPQNDPQTTDKPGTRRDTSIPASRSGPTEAAPPRRAINRGSGADFGGLFDSLAAFRSDGAARGGARNGTLSPGETRIRFEGKSTIKIESAPQPGKGINAPTILDYVPPVYPSAAEAAGVQGVVHIEAAIDENGRVQEAKVRRSIPHLDQAAIDAVKQWKYSPARNLAGVPISAIMSISVTFQLK